MKANVKNKYRLRKQLQEWLYDLVEKYTPLYDISVSIDDSEKDSFTLHIEMSFADNVPPIIRTSKCPIGAVELRSHLEELGRQIDNCTKEYERSFRFAIEANREKSRLLDIFNRPGGI